MRSVSLPTQPAAEISAAAGLRPKIGDIQFDLGATYYDYPGQILTGGATSLNYWEASLDASYDVRPDVTIGGEIAWSPNYGGIGAWGAYAEGNLKIKLPKLALPEGIEWELNAIVGRSWSGNTPSLQGGLPAYTHWQAGVTFKYQAVSLDLSYHDTDLSREACFIETGDTRATPGGAVTIDNPLGLQSHLCGPAIVGTLSFELEAK